ncbi:MAG: lysine 5,6-aminomutase reactivase subunit KamB [Solirubrobacteraceae bacterium]
MPQRPADRGARDLAELTASNERLALVGLAKNTGKTETLAALLRELRAAGRRVGVTSVGRDGEAHDVIDARIEKPRIQLAGGSLVATTDELLRASGIPHELLETTDVRTPLGRVLIARLRGAGAIEVAGPSASDQVRAVSDAMLGHGAEQVLIDGAIDRRAASSPAVADGMVMSTGAVLSEDIAEVVAQTRDAVNLARLPSLDGSGEVGRRLRALLTRDGGLTNMLVSDACEAISLPPRFALSSDAAEISRLLGAHPDARWLVVEGALPERFLLQLAHVARLRPTELTVVVGDPTKVFLTDHGLDWYHSQKITLQTLDATALMALTVNPVAPMSHRLDSKQLRSLVEQAIPGLAVLDVLASA